MAKFEVRCIRRRFQSGLSPSSNEPKIHVFVRTVTHAVFTPMKRDLAMRPTDLLAWLRQVPFVSFRLCLNSGRTYEIRHPEMLRVGRSSVNFYSFVGAPEDPYERMEMISLVLIERIEPIETAIPA
jgi:hypothetical protein